LDGKFVYQIVESFFRTGLKIRVSVARFRPGHICPSNPTLPSALDFA